MNPVVHFEMPYDNPERITRFYQSAFGWKLQGMGPEMGNYILAVTAEADAMRQGAVRGAINGGFFARSAEMPGQHPSVVIGVDDIQASMTAVNQAGGEVLGTPMQIPGVGKYVSFHDTERNRVSMLQPLPAGAT